MPVRLQDIALPIAPIASTTTGAAALSLFLSDTALFALPVRIEAEDGDEPEIALVTRARLTEALAGPNGRDVYAARPVYHLITPCPVIASGSLPVALVAKQAAEQGTSALTDGVIVTEEGQYRGLVSSAAILKAVAEENASRARAQQASNRRIEDMKTKMQALADGRARFLAFVGHEIRTPLTGILGVADLLKDQTGGEAKRLAETISHSGQHLERLLNDLLDLSRLEAGKLPVMMQPFDLRQFASETRDLWQPKLDAKRVGLRIAISRHAEARIESDAGRLRQILFNLVSNAVKFTERGHVTVQLATVPAGDGLSLVMTVADTGRGISDADKARLFEEFEQADDTTSTTHGGTGLGLSIARALTRRLGGEIAVADNSGGGCLFTVTVPVQKAGPRLAVENSAFHVASRKFDLGEILVAEDHETTAFVIREALLAAGWRVECVNDAEAAAQRLSLRSYQAVLTDIHMPGGGGEAVLRAVRFGPGRNSPIPVLALTADATEERRASCEALGFSGLIEKPIRPRTLVAALADTLLTAAPGKQAHAI